MLNKLKQKLTGADAGHIKYKYPGTRDAIDGNTAVIMVEREASQAAGASTTMARANGNRSKPHQYQGR